MITFWDTTVSIYTCVFTLRQYIIITYPEKPTSWWIKDAAKNPIFEEVTSVLIGTRPCFCFALVWFLDFDNASPFGFFPQLWCMFVSAVLPEGPPFTKLSSVLSGQFNYDLYLSRKWFRLFCVLKTRQNYHIASVRVFIQIMVVPLNPYQGSLYQRLQHIICYPSQHN